MRKISQNAGALVVFAAGFCLSTPQAFAAETKTPREKAVERANERNQPNSKAALDEGVTEPSLQPKGVELGSFLLFPSAEIDVSFTNNLFAEQNNTNSDWVTVLRPALKLQSQLPEHALNLAGTVEARRHRQYSSDDHENYQLIGDGRYDLSAVSEIKTLFSTRRYFEDRGSDDDVSGKAPTEAVAHLFGLGVQTKPNRFLFSADAQVNRMTFGDVETQAGAPINNSDRDRWEYSGEVRAGYEIFPGYMAQTAWSANRRTYDDARDDLGYQRDSKGWRGEAGLGLDLGQVLRGDLLFGYMSQTYEDTRFGDVSGPSVRATLNWSPTRVTLVVPALERSVQETSIANASGIVRTAASLSVRHELQRNIIAYGYASYYVDRFEGLSSEARNIELRARMMYAFTDNFYSGLQISYRDKDSDLNNASYSETRIGVRFGVQM